MNAIIIEDEEIIGQVLAGKIKKIASDINILAVLPSLRTARKWLSENALPDLMFMDIQLSDGVSFDLFDQFSLTCQIIFTTAYDEYAIRAFKVNGTDYLLKPVKEAELQNAIEKCRNRINHSGAANTDIQSLIQQLANPSGAAKYKEKFIVNVRNQWKPVNTNEIACFSKEVLIYLHTLSGEKFILDYATLDELEELLDPRKFYRATRQVILNIDALETVKPIENSKLVIKLKEPNQKIPIEMSRLKSPEFKRWLDR